MLIDWLASRIANRLIDEALHPERYPIKPRARLEPECRFIVQISEEAVSCERPGRRIEQVKWDDLQRVEILTNSDGPFLPDAFWVLSGTNQGCVIPWGATGERELLERLQQLPNWDNTAVINSSLKTDEAMTLCWQKRG